MIKMNTLNQLFVVLVLSSFFSNDIDVISREMGEGSNDNTEVTVTRDDFVKSMDKEFQKRDTNGDGILVRAEIELFERSRLNTEILAENMEQFDRLDQNGDKYLSAEEFRGMVSLPSLVNVDNIMDRFDLNKDQAVSLIEFRRETLKKFDLLDTDFDGRVISKVESQGYIGR